MAAVLMLVRSRLRRRWRAWVALTVMLGVAAGVVLTAAAGARRTDSAYPRYLEWAHADDLLASVDDSLAPDVARLPQVSDAALGIGFNIYRLDHRGRVSGDPQRAIGATDDDAVYHFDRPHVIAGRLADPNRADEATVNPTLARLWNLHPDERITLRAFVYGDQLRIGNGSQPVSPGVGTARTFLITGIVAGADDVIADPRRDITRLNLTPAYVRAHRAAEEGYSGMFVRLRHGHADLAAFEAAAYRLARGAAVGAPGAAGLSALVNPRAAITARVQHAIQPEVVALWLFAGLVAATTLLIAGQAVSRQLFLEADDIAVLRAMGMSPLQLAGAGLLQVGLMAIAGALLGVIIAVAASSLMPIGVVALVEPQPGISADFTVLGTGIAATVLLLLLREALPAWRLARGAQHRVGQAGAPSETQGARLAGAMSRAGLPPSTVLGVRMALEPGRGRTAVPVRSSMAGTALAVAAVMAALTFGSSLTTLITTPSLYGWNWDYQIDGGFTTIPRQQLVQGLGHDPDVAAFAAGSYGRLRVGGLEVPAVGLVDLQGAVPLKLVDGRSAAAPDEIVLGAATLGQIHRSVGDTVEVAGDTGSRTMRVVGRAVFPVLGIGDFAPTSLGDGAAVTVAGLDAVGGSANAAFDPRHSPRSDVSFALIRFRPGVDAGAAEGRIAAQLPRFPYGPELATVLTPTDIATYDRLRLTPLLLAAMLGVLGTGTLAHALISAVRRRARELAVLKTLGFVRRQVWVVVAWQATTLAAVALAAGVPLGVAAGRWAWSLFAAQVGVVDESTVPVPAVLLAIPAAVALANLLAAVPGRLAARVHPALVLRSE